MPRVMYEKWNPKADALDIVDKANEICATYAEQGYDLTLRQLYYQFVARGYIPNTQKDYSRLGEIVNRARLSGMLDWDYIIDRTRNLASLAHWTTPDEIVRAAASSFRFDMWQNQPVRVEVWVEKEALAGVVGQVAERYDCAWFSCRGYVSQSEQWRAAQRHLRYLEDGQAVVVLHLGDHDPSGIDMTRDISDRLHKFIYTEWARNNVDELDGDYTYTTIENHIFEHVVENRDEDPPVDVPHSIHRIALNYDQVEEYNPPPNPAKLTDSRSAGYVAEHGYESWELDALPPDVLDDLIASHIEALRDEEAWIDRAVEQEREREVLDAASSRWEEVAAYLSS